MGDSGNPFAIRCNAYLMRAIVYSGLGLTCFDSLVENGLMSFDALRDQE